MKKYLLLITLTFLSFGDNIETSSVSSNASSTRGIAPSAHYGVSDDISPIDYTTSNDNYYTSIDHSGEVNVTFEIDILCTQSPIFAKKTTLFGSPVDFLSLKSRNTFEYH